LGHAQLLQLEDVGVGDDAAAEEDDVVHAAFLEAPDDLREDRHVRAREQAHSEDVHVFLHGRVDDLLRGAMQAGVDDVHARVTEAPRHDAHAAVVAVQPHLRQQDSNVLVHVFPPLRARLTNFAYRVQYFVYEIRYAKSLDPCQGLISKFVSSFRRGRATVLYEVTMRNKEITRVSQGPTLLEQAYDAILGAICDGRLPPGERLNQDELAAQLQISRQPVGQALSLLRSQGFVRDNGRRGLIVAPLERDFFIAIYQLREALDPLAARLAAERCTPADGAEGSRILAEGRRALRAGNVTG